MVKAWQLSAAWQKLCLPSVSERRAGTPTHFWAGHLAAAAHCPCACHGSRVAFASVQMRAGSDSLFTDVKPVLSLSVLLWRVSLHIFTRKVWADIISVSAKAGDETPILHCDSWSARMIFFLLCFTSALNCVGFLESSVARHPPRNLPLYHSECARAPVALPDIFKHALLLRWSWTITQGCSSLFWPVYLLSYLSWADVELF